MWTSCQKKRVGSPCCDNLQPKIEPFLRLFCNCVEVQWTSSTLFFCWHISNISKISGSCGMGFPMRSDLVFLFVFCFCFAFLFCSRDWWPRVLSSSASVSSSVNYRRFSLRDSQLFAFSPHQASPCSVGCPRSGLFMVAAAQSMLSLILVCLSTTTGEFSMPVFLCKEPIYSLF